MKRVVKRALLIVLAAVVLIAAVAFAYVYPMLQMNPAPTGPVADTGVYALNNRLNSLYFIPYYDGYIAVDAGSNGQAVEQALPEIGIDPGDVKYVLLTHSDYDHVAALPLFPNAAVCMSGLEGQMLDGTTRRNAFSSNSLPEGVNWEEMQLTGEGHSVLMGEHRITCIAAPGHTPGSMAYQVGEKYLFTGDAFQVKDGVLAPHPYTMDKTAAKESMAKLAQVMEDVEYVFTAHYGYFEADQLTVG